MELPLRLKYYSIEFTILVILYILFYNSNIDFLIFLTFLFSSLYYVFAREVLPTKESLKSPAVSYYRSSRINIYGNLMSALLASIALLYFALTFYLNIRQGIATLVVWLIMIIFTFIITNYSRNNIYIDSIIDFIGFNLKTKVDEVVLNKIIKTFEGMSENNIINSTNILQESYYIDPVVAKDIIALYLEFKAGSLEKLNSDEIEAVNEK